MVKDIHDKRTSGFCRELGMRNGGVKLIIKRLKCVCCDKK